MLRAVPIFLLSLSVRIRSTRGIMVSLSINTNTGDSGFTFEGWIHPFSSSAPTHDYLFKTHTTDYRDVRVIVENCSSVEFSFWDNNNGNPGRGTEHQFFPGGLSCGTWSHVYWCGGLGEVTRLDMGNSRECIVRRRVWYE
jgi:hypothetical protein